MNTPINEDVEAANSFDLGATHEGAAETQPQQPPVEVAPASSLSEAFAELKRLEALPSRNSTEEREKATRLAQTRKRVFDLQQGCPSVEVTADSIAQDYIRLAPERKRQRLEALALEHAEVRDFIAQYDALTTKSKGKK